MDKLIEKLPELISAAAQSNLGIFALLSIALSVLAYFFFAGASVRVRAGIFVLLFLGVVGFGTAMFRVQVSAPTPAPKACRDKSHGIESYGRTFNVTLNSFWMGGGFDQTKWCNQVIETLRSQHPEGAFEVVTSSETTKDTCPPFNCPQYMYFCTVRVKTDPIYVEKASSACR